MPRLLLSPILLAAVAAVLAAQALAPCATAAAATAAAVSTAAPPPSMPGPDPAARFGRALAGGDEVAWRQAWLAVAARQGLAPAGLLDAMDHARTAEPAPDGSAVAVARGPPLPWYVDAYLFCDTNGDGRREVVENVYDLTTGRPQVKLLDGVTGRVLYVGIQQTWFPMSGLIGTDPYARLGDPLPARPFAAQDFALAPDLNGDGICDLVTYSFTFESLLGRVGLLDGAIRALSGAFPSQQIWSQTFVSTFTFVQAPGGVFLQVEILDFPTGFLAFPAPGGPGRFVFKTSDFHATLVQDPTGTVYAINMWASEHVQMHDLRTGSTLWTRDLNFTTQGTNRTTFAWVSGVGDLTGDGEPDVAMDTQWQTTPRGNEVDNPVDNTPFFRYGRGMDVMALDGAPSGSGATLWKTVVWDDGAARVNPPAQEEGFEQLAWSYASLLPDLNGDGRPEVLASPLTVEGAEATTVDGALRTHFVPLDGATGKPLWPGQVRYQGWGYATPLRPGNSTDLVAIGTVDLPSAIPAGARFPPKEVRMAVLRASDGSPQWSYEERYAQDSAISADLTLQQYKGNLAPLDVDGDGVRDLLTPGAYIDPGTDQVLLSTAQQRFSILSGATGKPLSHFDAYGSNGIAFACASPSAVPADPGNQTASHARPGSSLIDPVFSPAVPAANITVLGGYGQHVELTRIDAATGQSLWHQALWIDPDLTPAASGVDLLAMGGRCADDEIGRTMVGADLLLQSDRRGFEVQPMVGFAHAPEVLEAPRNASAGPRLATPDPFQLRGLWLQPDMLAQNDLLAIVAKLQHPVPPPTLKERATVTLTPAIPGALIGAGIAVVRNRKLPRTPRVPRAKLPDLYGGDE